MRLIDAKAVEKKMRELLRPCDIGLAIRAVREVPTVDAVPVVHGRWDDSGRYEFADGSTAVRCSICGACISEKDFNDYFWYYCPICGAKMDGGNDG